MPTNPLRHRTSHGRRASDRRSIPNTPQPTRAIKRPRPNLLVEYELRICNLRVLYNVGANEVVLLVIGRKIGNTLIVKGTEFHDHEDNPPQQPRS